MIGAIRVSKNGGSRAFRCANKPSLGLFVAKGALVEARWVTNKHEHTFDTGNLLKKAHTRETVRLLGMLALSQEPSTRGVGSLSYLSAAGAGWVVGDARSRCPNTAAAPSRLPPADPPEFTTTVGTHFEGFSKAAFRTSGFFSAMPSSAFKATSNMRNRRVPS